MSDLVITYTSHHGRQEERKFRSDDKKIDLFMRAATSVDISPLAECTALEVLELSHNQLAAIDLSSLENIRTLRRILLRDNHLTGLNLWPLAESSLLEYLDISGNRLRNLDITPVARCSLVELDASVVVEADPILKYVLTEPRIKKQFQSFRTDYTLESSWTATPIVLFKSYSQLSEEMGWHDTFTRIEKSFNGLSPQDWFPLQRGLLEGMGVPELGGYDGDPGILIESVRHHSDFTAARDALYDCAVEQLLDQVERNGPTLFLDTEKMKGTRASKLIPAIAELRLQELEDVVIPTMEGTALLHSLWLTSYGYELLMAMGYGLTIRCEELDPLIANLEGEALNVKLQRVDDIPEINCERFSESFCNHVFAIAERSDRTEYSERFSRFR